MRKWLLAFVPLLCLVAIPAFAVCPPPSRIIDCQAATNPVGSDWLYMWSNANNTAEKVQITQVLENLLTTHIFGLPAQAVCANAAGDGAIIQSAVAIGYPTHIAGPCDLDSPITLSTPGQVVYGDGRTITALNVSTVLTGGAFVCNTGEPGPEIHDLGIIYAQANTAVRGDLVPFTPAFECPNTPRMKLVRVRIGAAMTGIDWTGNSGGSVAEDVECSAMTVCIDIDGAEDSMILHDIQVWPFNMPTGATGCATATATGLCVIWNQPNPQCDMETTSGSYGPIGVYVGRGDDVKLSDSKEVVGQSVCVIGSDLGNANMQITDNAFDTFSGLIFNQPAFTGFEPGSVTVDDSYFNLITGDYQAIALSAGNLQVSPARFLQQTGSNIVPVIDVTGGTLVLGNFFAELGDADVSFLWADTAGNVSLSNGLIDTQVTSPVNNLIVIGGRVPGPTAEIEGVSPLSSVSSGTFINIVQDGYHRIIGNGLETGWSDICPSATHGVYANNGTVSGGCN